jgi:hypothetical protein
MKTLTIIIIASLVFSINLFSLERNSEQYNYSIGGIVGFDMDSHSALFSKFSNTESVGSYFKGGSSTSLNYGIVFDYKIGESLYLSTRLSLSNKKIDMTAKEFIGYGEYDQKKYPVYSNHNLQTDLNLIQISPAIKYNPFSDIPIGFSAGLCFGIFSNSTFSITQSLDQDAIDKGFQYLINGDTKTTFVSQSGDIQKMNSLFLSGFGAVSYNYKLSKSFSMVPQASYWLNFIGPVNNTDWKINTFEFSIAFMYLL